MPVLALITTLPPWQNVVAVAAVAVAVGNAFTVTLAAADVSEHPPEVTNLRYQVLAVSAAGA